MQNWKISITAFISILLLGWPCARTSSCADPPYYEGYRFYLFQPDLGNIPRLRPFYFSMDYYFGDAFWDDSKPAADDAVWANGGRPSYYRSNIKEWKVFCGEEVKADDIDSILYSCDPEHFLSVLDSIRAGVSPASFALQHNSFFHFLFAKKNKDALDYIVLAKRAEQLSNYDDPWELNDRDLDGLDPLLKEIDTKREHSAKDFFRMRYAYQSIKLRFYGGAGHMGDCDSLYHAWFDAVNTGSWIKPSAMIFTLYWQSRAERNYDLSKVFDMSDERKFTAVDLFDRDELQQSLSFAKNAHERAVMLTMYYLRDPSRSMRGLQKIYRLDPSARTLGTLLVREINKIEDWVCTPELTSYDPANPFGANGYDWNYNFKYNHKRDEQYMNKFLGWVEEVAAEKKVSDPALWELSAAYLALLAEKKGEALAWVEKAMNEVKISSLQMAQLKVIRFLAELDPSHFNENAQQDFESTLRWLDVHRSDFIDYDTFTSQFMLYVSGEFLRAGDAATAALLLSKNKRDMGMDRVSGLAHGAVDLLVMKGQTRDIERIIRLLKTGKSSGWEKFLLKGCSFSIDGLYDLEGTWFIHHDQLDSAYSCFSKVDEKYWENEANRSRLNMDPFYVDNVENHYNKGFDTVDYHNKAKYVKRMLELKHNVAMKKNTAQSCYLLGNAYYNMTWFGNSWAMMKFSWHVYGAYNAEKNSLNDVYCGCRRAEDYYLTGLKSARDDSTAAICALMAGICERNRKVYRTGSTGKVDFLRNKYRDVVLQRFGSADVFDSFRECSFLEEYQERLR